MRLAFAAVVVAAAVGAAAAGAYTTKLVTVRNLVVVNCNQETKTFCDAATPNGRLIVLFTGRSRFAKVPRIGSRIDQQVRLTSQDRPHRFAHHSRVVDNEDSDLARRRGHSRTSSAWRYTVGTMALRSELWALSACPIKNKSPLPRCVISRLMTCCLPSRSK